MRETWGKGKIVFIILDLRRRKEAINSNHVQKNHQNLYGAAVRHFGGWRQAVETARLNYAAILLRHQRSWSANRVVAAICHRFRQKLPINGFAVYKQDRGLYQAAKRYFGLKGYEKALKIAGFDPKELNPKLIWPKKRVMSEILKRYRRGVPLNVFWMLRYCRKLYMAGRNRFGSWKKAVQTAGLNYAEIKKQKIFWWTPNRVIYQIKRLERAGIRLSSKFIHLSHGDLFAAATKIFGSWSQAVEAAGIDYRLHCKIWSSKAFVRKLTETDVETIEQSIQQLAQKRRKE